MNRILFLSALVFFAGAIAAKPVHASTATNTTSQPAPPKPVTSTATITAKPGPGSPTAGNSASNMPAISPAEWQQLNSAREAAIKANPDLLKKAAELSDKMKAFQQKLDAAMIQANPNMAPMIAKLEQRQNAPPMPRSVAPNQSTPPAPHP
jgi:hypothetical protein